MAQGSSRTIRASAPAKLVLSGEYAVLLGAPALVLAINRRATCNLNVTSAEGWQFRSDPPYWNSTHSIDFIRGSTLSHSEAFTLRLIGDHVPLPAHAEVMVDTTGFFEGDVKLGIGSSAASLVALCSALGEYSGAKMSLQNMISVHSEIHGSGSGLDVASSYLGGLISFQNKKAEKLSLLEDLKIKFVFVGTSAKTSSMVGAFRHWVGSQPPRQFDQFCSLATAVLEARDDVGDFLDALARFTDALLTLDRQSRLGIWGRRHLEIKSIADELGVIYKPSGAGAGDMGIAVADDPELLEIFGARTKDSGYFELNAQLENDGVRCETSS